MIDAADSGQLLDSETLDRTAVLDPRGTIASTPPVGQAPEEMSAYPLEKCRCMTVTPAIAMAAVVGDGARHRPVDRRHVDKLAGEMAAGRFQVDGDAICFDWNGRLINVQHRLRAVIKSGLSVPMLVVEDLDPEAGALIDRGLMVRGYRDLRAIPSAPRTGSLNAALLAVCRHELDPRRPFRGRARRFWKLGTWAEVKEAAGRAFRDGQFLRGAAGALIVFYSLKNPAAGIDMDWKRRARGFTNFPSRRGPLATSLSILTRSAGPRAWSFVLTLTITRVS